MKKVLNTLLNLNSLTGECNLLEGFQDANFRYLKNKFTVNQNINLKQQEGFTLFECILAIAIYLSQWQVLSAYNPSIISVTQLF